MLAERSYVYVSCCYRLASSQTCTTHMHSTHNEGYAHTGDGVDVVANFTQKLSS